MTYKKSKYLVINADDFGISNNINHGIQKSYSEGILTSTSIMANGQAFESAIDFCKENSGLGIGVHLALVDGKPLLDKNSVPTLVNSDGEFPASYLEFAKNLYMGKIDLSEIQKELDAQIKEVAGRGIKIGHLDSHQHVHHFPLVSDIVLALAKKHNIPWVRKVTSSNLGRRSPGIIALNILANRLGRKAKSMALRTTDKFLGAEVSGNLDEHYVSNAINMIRPGVTELMCHPGYADASIDSTDTHWYLGREKDMSTLLSSDIKNLVKEHSITLTNYKELGK